MKLFVAASVVVMVCTIGQQKASQPTFSDFMQRKVNADMLALIEKVEQFRQTPTHKTLLLKRRFNEVRTHYKRLEWVAVALCSPTQLQRINGNRQWLNYNHPTQDFYPETGAFQRIELALSNDSSKVNIQNELVIIASFLDDLAAKLQRHTFDKADLFYQLANSLHHHYATTLNAYDRIEEQQSLVEFSEVLVYQIELLQSETLHDESVLPTLLTLYDIVRGLHQRDWTDINRAELYRFWILPVVKAYMERANYYDYEIKENDPIALGSHSMFSTPFFNRAYFTDLPAASTALEQLGKSLFYDPMLSANNKRSCASCHKSSKAFSDGRQTSIAFNYTSKGDRNSPSLINSIYKKQFQHDLSKDNLLEQISFVVAHPKEFNTSWQDIQKKLNTSEGYRQQFEACFQTTQITPEYIALALEAYIATLVSMSSSFDQFMSGETDDLPPLAAEGYNLFMSKAQCGNCHLPPLFSGTHFDRPDQSAYFKINSPKTTSQEQGLASSPAFDEAYTYFFAVPTVRNLDYTSPYFHNGSVLDLKECLNAHQQQFAVELSEHEQAALLAFLSSLNDPNAVAADESIELPLTDGTLAPVHRRSAGVY